MKTKPEEKRTLFVKFSNATCKKITVPEGCKVTFGPLCPGSKNAQHNSEGAVALRIYKGASQIAVFVKVESFYEVDSVTCIQKETKKASKNQEYQEGGVTKNRVVAVEVTEWKDELDESEEDASTAKAAFMMLKQNHDS